METESRLVVVRAEVEGVREEWKLKANSTGFLQGGQICSKIRLWSWLYNL